MWLSTRDLGQLFECCITTEKEPGSSMLVNGMSNNEGMVWDIEETRRRLGYEPQDGLTLQEMSQEILAAGDLDNVLAEGEQSMGQEGTTRRE
jgi:hypothetical protein